MPVKPFVPVFDENFTTGFAPYGALVDALQASVPELYNIRGFGAVGDGIADDGPAIAQAFTTASANGGGYVFFPAGTYRHTNTLTRPSTVVMIGCTDAKLADNPIVVGKDGIWRIGANSSVDAPSVDYVDVKNHGIIGVPNAVGDGVTDDEPAIQAVLNVCSGLTADGTAKIAGALSSTYIKPVYFPDGAYLIGKPLRVKTATMFLFGCRPAGGTKAEFWGAPFTYGPMIVQYPDHNWDNGDPGNLHYPTSLNLVAPLLTGTGYAFDLTKYNNSGGYPPPSGKADDNERLWMLRPDTVACELNGRAAFCVEGTIKIQPVSLSPYATGSIAQSTGKLWGFSADGTAECFGLILDGSPRKLKGWITSGGTKSAVLAGTTTLVDNATYHVALDYDGSFIRLFVNGVMEAKVAKTGTLTQKNYEHITLGQTFAEYPEALGGSYTAAPVLLDGFRMSKVSRYGSDTSFTPPTAKWGTADTDTLLHLNFDENFDALTTAHTGQDGSDRKVYLVLRRPGNYTQQSGTRMEYLNLYGWFGAKRSGIWTNNCPSSRYHHVDIDGYAYAFYSVSNSYQCDFTDCVFSARTRSGSDLMTSVVAAFAAASGVNNFTNTHFTGGRYQLAASDANVNGAFFNCSTDTNVALLSWGGGESQVLLNKCGVSREVGGPNALAAYIVGIGGRLVLTGGAFEHFDGEPGIINEQGQVVAFGVNDHTSPDDATKPVFMQIKPGANDYMPTPSLLVGCRRHLFQASAAKQDKWTDKPQHLQVVGNGGLKPIKAGGKIISQTGGGTVTIDCADQEKFVIQVEDTTAFTIASPINMKAGQRISIVVQNWSGGVMGAITWGLSYRFASWTNPANNKERRLDGEYLGPLGWSCETSSADVPLPNYVPADFSGLIAHWKADSLALVDNDPVASWLDETAENNDLAQSTAGRRPIYKTNIINSKPAVLFDGVDDYLVAAGAPPASWDAMRTNRTVFVLARSISEPTAGVEVHGVFGQGVYRFYRNYTKELVEFFHNGTEYVGLETGTDTWPVNTWILASTSRNDATSLCDAFLDGVAKAQESLGAVASGYTNAIEMGRVDASDSYCFDGYIAEIIVYNRALNSDERQAIEQYLARKYDLTIGVAFE